jgi:ribosomal protein S18 acetylase RimI-like enzyme
MGGVGTQLTIVDVDDERTEAAAAAFDLIERTFDRRDRQPLEELRSEIAEKRIELHTTQEYHLLAALDADGHVMGTITGLYLAGVNAGFVTYLAVESSSRRTGLGRRLRATLVERFRATAKRRRDEDLAWVLGEVRVTSPWLRRLVQNRGAVPFDLTYFHPGVRPPARPVHALYRQPVSDHRVELPAQLVRRILYAVYRRGYRVRYPLLHTGFLDMLGQIGDREMIGMLPRFAQLTANENGDAS